VFLKRNSFVSLNGEPLTHDKKRTMCLEIKSAEEWNGSKQSAVSPKNKYDGMLHIKKFKVNRLASATFEYVTLTQIIRG